MDMASTSSAVPSTPWTVSLVMAASGSDGHAGHNHASAGAASWTCEGSPWAPYRIGSWSGHVLCGVALLVWGLHWAFATFKAHATASPQSPFRSRATHAVPLLPPSWPLEAALKVAVPLLAVLLQLWGSNGGAWRDQVCSVDTPQQHVRFGHFSVANLAAWQSAVVLSTFMLSGVADLLALRLELPSHTQEFFLGLGFLFEGLGLSTNVPSNGFEAMLYYLVYLTAMASALVIFLQAAYPDDFFLSVARAYTVLVQGTWMLAIARFQFEGHPAWDTVVPVMDMAPEMVVPVVFVAWLNVLSVLLLILFLSVRWWHTVKLPDALKAGCSVERTLEVGGNGAPHKSWHHSNGNGNGNGHSSGGGRGEAVLEMKALLGGKP